MKNITLNVSIDEANTIFKALGKLPFEEVYELIGKLNEQANEQTSQPEESILNSISYDVNGN
ncbi:hypothetical protein [Aureibacter tunicatorum]|uniref:Uncharacterized protein n=1 Tax=Aureibacter tunicatorum TaxID=866807 RepID=A0AAE3XK35_9BACT|nr:hypothetical protein [Aureibacter tunicatorum]MDR6237443.1 hypothetical protein [Aureibacter tunicatorum]BDD06433.1 hypothetical protein AUTU_39160 [Aureibacter tunicatorum]